MTMKTDFNNITEILERNAAEWPSDVALVEIDTPDDGRHKTWKEAELVESVPDKAYRAEMTWRDFDEKANRFANFLLSRGYKRGDKVAILLMNCLEWLPRPVAWPCRSTSATRQRRFATAWSSLTPVRLCSGPSSPDASSR